MKTPEITNAIKLGNSADLGPPSVTKFDQVRLPKEKTKGPVSRARYITLLTRSLPGKGLLLLVSRVCLFI